MTNRYHLLLPCQIVSTFLIKNREHTFCIHVVSDQSILVRDESIVAYLNVYMHLYKHSNSGTRVVYFDQIGDLFFCVQSYQNVLYTFLYI